MRKQIAATQIWPCQFPTFPTCPTMSSPEAIASKFKFCNCFRFRNPFKKDQIRRRRRAFLKINKLSSSHLSIVVFIWRMYSYRFFNTVKSGAKTPTRSTSQWSRLFRRPKSRRRATRSSSGLKQLKKNRHDVARMIL